MDWQLINIMSTWAAALGAVTCFFAITRLIRFQSKTHREMMASLNEMSDTYKLAWTIVSADLQQLRERIEELENR